MSMRKSQRNKTPKSVIVVIFIAVAVAFGLASLLPPALSDFKVLTFMLSSVFLALGGVFVLSRIVKR